MLVHVVRVQLTRATRHIQYIEQADDEGVVVLAPRRRLLGLGVPQVQPMVGLDREAQVVRSRDQPHAGSMLDGDLGLKAAADANNTIRLITMDVDVARTVRTIVDVGHDSLLLQRAQGYELTCNRLSWIHTNPRLRACVEH